MLYLLLVAWLLTMHVNEQKLNWTDVNYYHDHENQHPNHHSRRRHNDDDYDYDA